MLAGGVNHEWFGKRQEKRGFRQEQGNQREGRLRLARQLKLMLSRRMRRMLTVTVIVTVLVVIVVVCRMGAGK